MTERREINVPMDEVEFEFIMHNEDISPYDQFEKEDAEKVVKEFNNGNPYAWFCAECRASYRNFSASEYLGGCSYESREDFLSEDGYWEDMKSMAYNQLLDDMQVAFETLQGLTV